MSIWKTAQSLLAKSFKAAGATTRITISRPEHGEYEPVPGENVHRGAITAPLSGEFDAIFATRDQTYADGQDLSSDETQTLTVFPGDFAPQTGDTVTHGEFSGKVLNCRTVTADNSTELVYALEVSF